MSHVSKIVSLAVALLFAGGIALAQDPSKVPPPAPKPPRTPVPFWVVLPTENEKIVAGTEFIVKLKANNPPPPIVYLFWQTKMGQDVSTPMLRDWGANKLDLEIPISEGFLISPGYYRVRAVSWDWKYYTGWRNFQIILKAPVPLPGK